MVKRAVIKNTKMVSVGGPQVYEKLDKIDGSHPFKEAVPFGYVEYQARTRHGGRVSYFNFELAREMGILSADHPDTMTPKLEASLLETFAIQIINENDLIEARKFKREDIKPGRYMATRYLQIQHPNKRGLTSGDGRSIWNGVIQNRGKIWDITSCGTGATCLSPATAQHNKFFRSGDPEISYGCGYSEISEGIGNAVYSEILYKSGVKSERCLCVIQFPRGFSINVRAGQNLLRPSHFFAHLKQGHRDRLKALIEYFVDREYRNGNVKKPLALLTRNQGILQDTAVLTKICEDFSKASARFETDYIFCWIEWDGDNILCDGGVIDYGSIRQFGLFHRDYRFDDDSRWSTTLTEQKLKARYAVQTFIQAFDFARSGKKRTVKHFANHPLLKHFDKTFEMEMNHLLCAKLGMPIAEIAPFCAKNKKLIEKFRKYFRYFESRITESKPKRYGDGISRHAIFSMRDFLRVFPAFYKSEERLLTPLEFLDYFKSPYMTKKDAAKYKNHATQARELQNSYIDLVARFAKSKRIEFDAAWQTMGERSLFINRKDRVTGDAMVFIVDNFMKKLKESSFATFYRYIKEFIDRQATPMEMVATDLTKIDKTPKSLLPVLRIVDSNRHSL